MYWETKTKEQQHQMEMLSLDAARVDSTLKQVDEQVSTSERKLLNFGRYHRDLFTSEHNAALDQEPKIFN